MIAYLDHAATTQVKAEVVEAMIKVYRETYGNPSSMHAMGLEAEKVLKAAKKDFSKLINCSESELVFTSGGTEANNLAIQGLMKHMPPKKNHIITSQVEHPSVLSTIKELENQGYRVSYLPVDSNGHILMDKLEEALCPETALVSIMYVNNELGTIMDIGAISKLVKRKSQAYLHVDAIQALGKIDCHVRRLGVDLMTFSGHKIHGPKGIGALYVKKSTPIKALTYGGSQERALRPGTENIGGIVGLALAGQAYNQDGQAFDKLMAIKTYMIDSLKSLEGYKINSPEDGAPHILNVSFMDMRGEVLLHELETKGIYVSTGSACSSKNKTYSHVLEAIGLDNIEKEGAIRFSFSKDTSKEEIDYAVEQLGLALDKLHKIINRR